MKKSTWLRLLACFICVSDHVCMIYHFKMLLIFPKSKFINLLHFFYDFPFRLMSSRPHKQLVNINVTHFNTQISHYGCLMLTLIINCTFWWTFFSTRAHINVTSWSWWWNNMFLKGKKECKKQIVFSMFCFTCSKTSLVLGSLVQEINFNLLWLF